MLRWILVAVAGFVAILLLFLVPKVDRIAKVGAGYKAKTLCSEIFVAGRNPDDVMTTEFVGMDAGLERISAQVDPSNASVTASASGLGKSTAAFHTGLGCTIERGDGASRLSFTRPAPLAQPWPEALALSDAALPTVDYAKIQDALDLAFEDESATHRAFVVIADGKLVTERYALGFDAETEFLSWSMAKSVTATLFGAAVKKGFVNQSDPAPVWEWDGDDRAAITWDDLLRMQSGLDFVEIYDDLGSDVNQMLFIAEDKGAVAAGKPAAYPPGEHWSYSSGTTNLIARTLAETLKANQTDIYEFAYSAVFDRIGAASFVLEPDPFGVPIGSSFMYATARDWARLGELYLRDGKWGDDQILPERWVDYVTEPAADSDGQYGAHFWLNRAGANGRAQYVPGLPDTTYFMAGHEGQYVFIIPSKDMIIVRTGMTRGAKPIDVVGPVVTAIYEAVADPS